MTPKPSLRRGLVLDTGRYAKLPNGWQLWIVEDGDRLEITEKLEPGEGTMDYFERAEVVAALEKVLGKRNDEYVPLDPEIDTSEYERGEWPEVPTLRRAEDGLILYTHECGEERYFPRAAARMLLAALGEG